MDDLTVLGRSAGPRGEVVLRRRGDGPDAVEELIVNGAFAMDSAETCSERALAALAAVGSRVVVGGLGLGYTVAELLVRPVAAVDVVEIEEALVGWARAGVTEQLAEVAVDPRVHLWVHDIAAVLSGSVVEPAGPWDAILLDVDNGPDFLVHAANADLYRPAALAWAYARLRPGGVLGIWCQGPDAGLWDAVRSLTPTATQDAHRVVRGRHQIDYVIYTARRPVREPGAGAPE